MDFDTHGRLLVNAATLPADVLTKGRIATTGEALGIVVPPAGSAVGVQITGTWSGQLEFEGSTDGITYNSVFVVNALGVVTNATTGTGIFFLPGAGLGYLRIRASAWTSGVAELVARISTGASSATTLLTPLPAGDNNIGNVDVVSSALPTGAATEATLALIKAKTDNLDVALSTRAVTGLTDAQLRATPVPVSGTITASGPLTDAQLRATPVPVSGTVSVTEPVTVDATDLDIRNLTFAADKVDASGSTGVGVTGPLTDAQLRATPVPVSGTVAVTEPVTVDATDLDIRNLTFAADKVDASGSTGVGVTGPLTDAQLRAVAVPVSGTVTATGPLTDAQLRATAVPISGSVTALDEDSATGTSSNVTGTGANVTILASNAARKGATIFNDSAVPAHVKLGATASATSFAVKMVDQSYYEVPYKYTGVIDGFWASGVLRVTELT